MLNGRKGLGERRELAALAPWLDEKPSARRGGQHWQGRSQTPKAVRGSERNKEKGKTSKLFILPSGRLWSNCGPGLKTKFLYMTFTVSLMGHL